MQAPAHPHDPAFRTISTGDIKPIFILLVDISGYTRFIKYHRVSLLHAEKIIAELMESILRQVEVPVLAHEILGDAISFYSINDGTPGQADKIYHQLQKYFDAFREKEASLISACGLCRCDACKQVGKLSLKAILHRGQAAFTEVFNLQKISGEDVILSHRLLKNSLTAKEYILMTREFVDVCRDLNPSELFNHHEQYDDVGPIDLFVKTYDNDPVTAAPMTFMQKLKLFMPLETYMLERIFKKDKKNYRNLVQHS